MPEPEDLAIDLNHLEDMLLFAEQNHANYCNVDAPLVRRLVARCKIAEAAAGSDVMREFHLVHCELSRSQASSKRWQDGCLKNFDDYVQADVDRITLKRWLILAEAVCRVGSQIANNDEMHRPWVKFENALAAWREGTQLKEVPDAGARTGDRSDPDAPSNSPGDVPHPR